MKKLNTSELRALVDDNRIIGALVFMLISTLLLASMHTMVRYLTAELHPFVVVFFRNFFGLIAVIPLFARSGIGILATRQPKLYAMRVSVGIVAMMSWFYALSKVPIPNATALSFSSTIFATLAAWLFLKETMRIRRWLAITVGLVGVLIVLQPGLDGFNRWALLATLAAMAWGVGIAFVKKLSTTDSTISIVALMSCGMTLVSIWPALFVWQWPTLTQLGWLFLVGCFASAGHYFMTSALRLADTAIVMSVDFSRLIWTAVLGYLFFGDVLSSHTVLGALVIFASAWYIIFRESRLALPQDAGDKKIS